ncbi:hypothetical protein GCM10010236_57610 [Streptomyces eurythermus]|nr:hypothetical protein GCM10010236_57610 [Streptomyces eurythermus]
MRRHLWDFSGTLRRRRALRPRSGPAPPDSHPALSLRCGRPGFDVGELGGEDLFERGTAVRREGADLAGEVGQGGDAPTTKRWWTAPMWCSSRYAARTITPPSPG